jgi:mannose-1-phosphate guanylyltransferase
VGVDDLVVVDTADAVLVSHKNASQQVKEVVRVLRDKNHEAYKLHTTVHRPWGTYTTLVEADGFKIKRIMVKPGQALSLQFHHKRAEHWVVVRGTATVQVGDTEYETHAGQSRYVPQGAKHRLANRTDEMVEIIEVQCGSYLGEDDIVRLVDNYGRVV